MQDFKNVTLVVPYCIGYDSDCYGKELFLAVGATGFCAGTGCTNDAAVAALKEQILERLSDSGMSGVELHMHEGKHGE